MGPKNEGVALVFVIMVILLVGGIFAGVGTMNYVEVLQTRNTVAMDRAKDGALFALGLAGWPVTAGENGSRRVGQGKE
ncbi:MAG: hypothetical protein LBB18_00250 [Puniceicoccales bacterium]|jgi:type II secretory pathway component PulK|nr:hypothetical protein [Puniceicoccales bacterium]